MFRSYKKIFICLRLEERLCVKTTVALYHKGAASFTLWMTSGRAHGVLLLNLLKRQLS